MSINEIGSAVARRVRTALPDLHPADGALADNTPSPLPSPTPTQPAQPTAPTEPPKTQAPAQPAPTPSPQPGPAPIAPMSTPEEQQADAAARAALAGDPDALAKYDAMQKNDLFGRHDGGYPGDPPGEAARARISIMKQIAAFPEGRVIDNLDQMSRRGWFDDMSPEDRQRATRLVAYGSSDTVPGAQGNDTRHNTIDAIVRSDDPPLSFADLRMDDTGVTWGQHKPGLLGFGESIELNRKLIAASDDPITAGSTDAQLATDTLAHEYNHKIRGGSNESSFDYFMNEYRAWYAGYVSENGHPPSRTEAFVRSRELTMTDLYPSLRDVLDGKDHFLDGNDAAEEQKKLVAFMAELSGLDPATATVDDIRQRSKADVPAGDATVPFSTDEDDPNNIDNHPG